MHMLHSYLASNLEKKISASQVVVWYDPREEFVSFIRELASDGGSNTQKVRLNSRDVWLIPYTGSFIQMKFAAEPYVGKDEPEPMLLYLPGVSRDKEGSLLMELEAAGTCFQPSLKQIARNVLRKQYTDGEIDEVLTDRVTYDDVVAYLQSGGESGRASKLKAVFPECKSSEMILANWLASDAWDTTLEDKEALPELVKLIAARCDYSPALEEGLAQVRQKTLRFVLVNEFRSDYQGENLSSLDMISSPQSQEALDRIRTLCSILRRKFPSEYMRMADQVDEEFGLAQTSIDPSLLGRIDTFRFEEKRLLGFCDQLAAEGRYQEAKEIVDARWKSFWVEQSLARHAQWEVCRLVAELGICIQKVQSTLPGRGKPPDKWVLAYTQNQGYVVDTLARRLENWVAGMEHEPEVLKGLHAVRQGYESLVHSMTQGFMDSLQQAGWQMQQTMHQTEVFSRCVHPHQGKTAYVLVDALRYEMGVELAERLSEALDLHLTPVMAALPTITPVGMAALLPEASTGFSVVERSNNVAAQVNNTQVATVNDRINMVKFNTPSMVDLVLSKLLRSSEKKLGQDIQDADLVLVRSQEIDALGEGDNEWLISQMMGNVIGNLARAVRKLAGCGVERFVIGSDHGFLLGKRKDEDMRLDHPGGGCVECHRRCWIGRGGTAASGTVRVQGAELGYSTDLDCIFPYGTGVFRTQGGLGFHHGGVSLQETIVPVLSFRLAPKESGSKKKVKVRMTRCPEKITNRTFGIGVMANKDLLDLIEEQSVSLRLALISQGQHVGHVGMAMDADFDRTTGLVTLKPGVEASVGMMLTKDDCKEVKVIIQDPETDQVWVQSSSLPVQLGL